MILQLIESSQAPMSMRQPIWKEEKQIFDTNLPERSRPSWPMNPLAAELKGSQPEEDTNLPEISRPGWPMKCLAAELKGSQPE